MNLLTLPFDIQTMIFGHAKLSFLSLAATSKKIGGNPSTESLLLKSQTILKLLKNSFQSISSKNLKGSQVPEWIRIQGMSQIIAEFDTQVAQRIVNSIKDDSDRARVQCELVKIIAKFNHEEATKLADSIERPTYRAEALSFLAEELAINDKDRAFDFVDLIILELTKVKALRGIAKVRAIFDIDEGLEIIKLKIEDPEHKITAYGDIVELIKVKDRTRALQLIGEAQDLVRELPSDELKAQGLANIASFCFSLDKVLTLKLIDKALEYGKSMYGATKGNFLVSIIKMLFPVDQARAKEVFSNIINEDFKDLALQVMGPKSTDTADQKEFIREKSLLDPAKAIELAFSIKNEYQKALAISDVLKVMAAQQPDNTIAFLKTMNADIRIIILLELVKAFIGTDPKFSKKLLDFAVNAALSETFDGKSILLVDIVRALQTQP